MSSSLISYAAFLRGIGPEDPNTRNAKLREVFEELGFTDVQAVISSGNVVFRARSKDAAALEKKIGRALTARLGFKKPVLVRSKGDLERLIRKDPFKGKEHGQDSYLIVTFLREKPRELFNVVDLATAKTPDIMAKLERKYGNAITTRTWKTVGRIVKKLNDLPKSQ